MPNTPQPPKAFLITQAAVPITIEASLPTGAPAISSLLLSFAQSVPDVALPALPAAIPGLPKLPAAVAGMPGADFLKSLQVSLPNGGPRLGGQNVKVGITEAPKPAQRAFKIGV